MSGAHINPAVTLAFAVRRKFPWAKVVPYWGAQIVGAFVGAALVYLVYHDAIDAFNLAAHTPEELRAGPGVLLDLRHVPGPVLPRRRSSGPLVDQIVGTAFLLMFVVAVIDLRNTAVGANLGPLIIGFAVAAIGMSFGANAGYAINPARDFGPRLFAYFAGWGKVALPGSYSAAGSPSAGYFWIPIVGPLIGGVIGVIVYDLFIGDILHARLKMAEEVDGPDPGDRAEPGTGTQAEGRSRRPGIPTSPRLAPTGPRVAHRPGQRV